MNINEFNKAQRMITKIEYADSILKYKEFYSLMVLPQGKSPTDHKNPLEKPLLGEKVLVEFIRSAIEDYKAYLISELKDLGVDYE